MLVVVHLKTRSAGFSTQETMKVLSVIFVNKQNVEDLKNYECIYKNGCWFRHVNYGTQINDEEKMKMKWS